MKISPLATLKESDLQIDEKKEVTGTSLLTAFKNLFAQLNPFFSSLNKLVAKGITFSENIQCDLIAGTFSHGVGQLVALKTLTRANGALVLGAQGQVAIGVTVTMQQGTAGSRPLATVTVYFMNSGATNVPVSLLLFPEGQQA